MFTLSLLLQKAHNDYLVLLVGFQWYSARRGHKTRRHRMCDRSSTCRSRAMFNFRSNEEADLDAAGKCLPIKQRDNPSATIVDVAFVPPSPLPPSSSDSGFLERPLLLRSSVLLIMTLYPRRARKIYLHVISRARLGYHWCTPL